MDLASFLKEHWQVITVAPLTFFLFGVAIVSTTALVTRVLLAGALDAARERLQGAKDEIQNLKAEKNSLLQKLECHGEDIASLKTELASMPRIRILDRLPLPGEGKIGDLYGIPSELVKRPDGSLL